MIESKFRAQFAKLAEEGTELFELRGSNILVEILPEQEVKTKGGLILAANSQQIHGSLMQHKALVGLVLMTGAGFYDDETGEDVPLDVKPGDVVLLPQFAITPLSNFPGLTGVTGNSLAIIKDESIIFRYKGQAAFEAASRLLDE
jgi:co-chaperonin GroES (HSP10)